MQPPTANKQNQIRKTNRPVLELGESPRLPNLDDQLLMEKHATAQLREEAAILATLPLNGCSCNRMMKVSSGQLKKGCHFTEKWLNIAYSEDNYLYVSSYKLYQGFLQQALGEGSH